MYDSNPNFINVIRTKSRKEILWSAELLSGEIYGFQRSTSQIKSCMFAINSKLLSYRRIECLFNGVCNDTPNHGQELQWDMAKVSQKDVERDARCLAL